MGQAVNFALPSNTFTDPQGEALTYSATLSNGAALPAWLSFNAATGTFSGTVANSATGLSVNVTATDTSGLSASETFSVLTPAAAPLLTAQTVAQTWARGQAVNFTLASNTFTDPQGQALSYGATQSNGAALPSWLSFNAATGTFSGTVANSANGLSVNVTATDSSGLSTSETFAIATPAPLAPTLTAQTAAQTWNTGQAVNLALAPNTFTDPQNEILTFTAAQANGKALPAWLSFNGTTDTFSGTAPASAGLLSFKVTATDSSGLSASEAFVVTLATVASQMSQAISSLGSGSGSGTSSLTQLVSTPSATLASPVS
jgi:putative Ig domain-containing protein